MGRLKFMRKILWITGLTLLILLSACSSENQNKKDAEENEVPEILEVQLEVPEGIKAKETLKMSATVTQGDDSVADADEVKYEIWENGKKDESIMVEANNNKDGTYDAETVIDKEGEYIVQVHVTARGMHNMPKKTVKVK